MFYITISDLVAATEWLREAGCIVPYPTPEWNAVGWDDASEILEAFRSVTNFDLTRSEFEALSRVFAALEGEENRVAEDFEAQYRVSVRR